MRRIKRLYVYTKNALVVTLLILAIDKFFPSSLFLRYLLCKPLEYTANLYFSSALLYFIQQYYEYVTIPCIINMLLKVSVGKLSCHVAISEDVGLQEQAYKLQTMSCMLGTIGRSNYNDRVFLYTHPKSLVED